MAVRIHTHCTRPGKGMGRKSNNSLVEDPTKHSVRTCRMHPGILSPHTNCAGGWNILDDYLIERLSISKETEGEKNARPAHGVGRRSWRETESSKVDVTFHI